MRLDRTNWHKPLLEVMSGVFSDDDVSKDGDDFLREVSAENIIDGNKHHALNQIRYHIYSSFTSNSLPTEDFKGVRFYDISKEKNLEYIIKAIKADTLSIGRVNFNDVHDPLLVAYSRLIKSIKDKLRRKWYNLLNAATKNFRIACLCPTQTQNGICRRKVNAVENELMWAHYAKNHTGICVEYAFKRETFEAINNARDGRFCFIAPVVYSDTVISLCNVTMRDALLKKSQMWKYEQERRIIYYDWKRDTDYVPLKAIVKAVYLGCAIDNNKAKHIMNELKNSNVPIFRMVYNKENLMKLKNVLKQE